MLSAGIYESLVGSLSRRARFDSIGAAEQDEPLMSLDAPLASHTDCVRNDAQPEAVSDVRMLSEQPLSLAVAPHGE